MAKSKANTAYQDFGTPILIHLDTLFTAKQIETLLYLFINSPFLHWMEASKFYDIKRILENKLTNLKAKNN
jgi:hypothetical protein